MWYPPPFLFLLLGMLAVPTWVSWAIVGFEFRIMVCVLGWALLWLAYIDWRTGRLPDAITVPLLLLGLLVTWHHTPDAVFEHLVGALGGFVAFAGLGRAYRAFRGVHGMGFGDAKLLAAGGAWLGWPLLPIVVLIAASIGLVQALWIGWRGGRAMRHVSIAFGPALGLAIWIVRLHAVPSP